MEKLKELRNIHNLTIRDMAKILKISPAYYCQIENKKRVLSYAMAVNISKIFKLKPDDIFYQKTDD